MIKQDAVRKLKCHKFSTLQKREIKIQQKNKCFTVVVVVDGGRRPLFPIHFVQHKFGNTVNIKTCVLLLFFTTT